jgi:O-acetylhomoserine/O-acetylserine sulfhydrylase-like pyridoxal-dependent enzyme
MLAADAGFVYSVVKAPTTAKVDARIAAGTRGGWTPHKASAVASMGVATISYLMMYVWKGEK